jgi:hypothetical protein
MQPVNHKSTSPQDLPSLATAAELRADMSHKFQNVWRQAYYWLVFSSSIFASVAGATALTQVWDGTLAGALALIASALMAAAASLQTADRSTGCGTKADEYWAIARDARRANQRTSGAAKQKAFHELRQRYDNARTNPEPPLPKTGS